MNIKFYLILFLSVITTLALSAKEYLPLADLPSGSPFERHPSFVNWPIFHNGLENSNLIYKYDANQNKWLPQGVKIPFKNELDNQSFYTVDPVRFSITANKTALTPHQEVELTITAQYLELHPSLAFQFEGSNEFTLKTLLPAGFVQTGGSYYDFIKGKVSKERPYQTFTIKGFFEAETAEPCFTLLRSHKNAGASDSFVKRGEFCVKDLNINIDIQNKIFDEITLLQEVTQNEEESKYKVTVENKLTYLKYSYSLDSLHFQKDNILYPTTPHGKIFVKNKEGKLITKYFNFDQQANSKIADLASICNDIFIINNELSFDGKFNFTIALSEINASQISEIQIKVNGEVFYRKSKQFGTITLPINDYFTIINKGKYDNVQLYIEYDCNENGINCRYFQCNYKNSIYVTSELPKPQIEVIDEEEDFVTFRVTNSNDSQYSTIVYVDNVIVILDPNKTYTISKNSTITVKFVNLIKTDYTKQESFVVNVRGKLPIVDLQQGELFCNGAKLRVNVAGLRLNETYVLQVLKSDNSELVKTEISGQGDQSYFFDINIRDTYTVRIHNKRVINGKVNQDIEQVFIHTNPFIGHPVTIYKNKNTNECPNISLISNYTDGIKYNFEWYRNDVISNSISVLRNSTDLVNTLIVRDNYCTGQGSITLTNDDFAHCIIPDINVSVSSTNAVCGPNAKGNLKFEFVGDPMGNYERKIYINEVLITTTKASPYLYSILPGKYHIKVEYQAGQTIKNIFNKADYEITKDCDDKTPIVAPRDAACKVNNGSISVQRYDNRTNNPVVITVYAEASPNNKLTSNQYTNTFTNLAIGNYYVEVKDISDGTILLPNTLYAIKENCDNLTISYNRVIHSNCNNATGSITASTNRVSNKLIYELYKNGQKDVNYTNYTKIITNNTPVTFDGLIVGQNYHIVVTDSQLENNKDEATGSPVTIRRECTTPTCSVIKQDAVCRILGSAVAQFDNRVSNNITYELYRFSPDANNKVLDASQNNNPAFNTLLENTTYQIRLSDNTAVEDKKYCTTPPFTIAKDCGTLRMETTKLDIGCSSKGSITIYAKGRTSSQFWYQITNSSGTINFGPTSNQSHTFNDLLVGTYYVQLFDKQDPQDPNAEKSENKRDGSVTISKSVGALSVTVNTTVAPCGGRGTVKATVNGLSCQSLQYRLYDRNKGNWVPGKDSPSGQGASYVFTEIEVGRYAVYVFDNQIDNTVVTTESQDFYMTRDCGPLTMEATKVDIGCNSKGSITITAKGRTSNRFMYLISNTVTGELRNSGETSLQSYTFNNLSEGDYYIELSDKQDTQDPNGTSSENRKAGYISIGRTYGPMNLSTSATQVPCKGGATITATLSGRSCQSFEYRLYDRINGKFVQFSGGGQGNNYTFYNVNVGTYAVYVFDYQSNPIESVESQNIQITKSCGVFAVTATAVNAPTCGASAQVIATISDRAGTDFYYNLKEINTNKLYTVSNQGTTTTFNVPAGEYRLYALDFQNGIPIPMVDEAHMLGTVTVSRICPLPVAQVDITNALCSVLGKLTVKEVSVRNPSSPKYEYNLISQSGAVIQKSGIKTGSNSRSHEFTGIYPGIYTVQIIDRSYEATNGGIIHSTDIVNAIADIKQDNNCLGIVAEYITNTAVPCDQRFKTTIRNGTGPYTIEMEWLKNDNIFYSSNYAIVVNANMLGQYAMEHYFRNQIPVSQTSNYKGVYRFKVTDRYQNIAYSNEIHRSNTVTNECNAMVNFSSTPATCGLDNGSITFTINAYEGDYNGVIKLNGLPHKNTFNTEANPGKSFPRIITITDLPAGTYDAYLETKINGTYTVTSSMLGLAVTTETRASINLANITAPNVCVGKTGVITIKDQIGKALWYDAPTGGTLLDEGNTLSITKPTAGSYTYYVAAQKGSCPETARRAETIQVKALPTTPTVNINVAAGIHPIVRSDENFTLRGYVPGSLPSNITKHTWAFAKTNTEPFITLTDQTVSLNITGANAARHQGFYKYTATNADGCEASDTYQQLIYPACAIALDSTSIRCQAAADPSQPNKSTLTFTIKGRSPASQPLHSFYKLVAQTPAKGTSIVQTDPYEDGKWMPFAGDIFAISDVPDGAYTLYLQEDGPTTLPNGTARNLDTAPCLRTYTLAAFSCAKLDCDNYYIKSLIPSTSTESYKLTRKTGNDRLFDDLALSAATFDGSPIPANLQYTWQVPTGQAPLLGAGGAVNKIGPYTLSLSNGIETCTAQLSLAGTACTDVQPVDYCLGGTPATPDPDATVIQTIAVGDQFTAANFTVTITEVSSAGGLHTGKGIAELILPGKLSVEVNVIFEGAQINDCYQLTSATEFITDYDPNWGNVFSIINYDDVRQNMVDQIQTALMLCTGKAEDITKIDALFASLLADINTNTDYTADEKAEFLAYYNLALPLWQTLKACYQANPTAPNNCDKNPLNVALAKFYELDEPPTGPIIDNPGARLQADSDVTRAILEELAYSCTRGNPTYIPYKSDPNLKYTNCSNKREGKCGIRAREDRYCIYNNGEYWFINCTWYWKNANFYPAADGKYFIFKYVNGGWVKTEIDEGDYTGSLAADALTRYLVEYPIDLFLGIECLTLTAMDILGAEIITQLNENGYVTNKQACYAHIATTILTLCPGTAGGKADRIAKDFTDAIENSIIKVNRKNVKKHAKVGVETWVQKFRDAKTLRYLQFKEFDALSKSDKLTFIGQSFAEAWPNVWFERKILEEIMAKYRYLSEGYEWTEKISSTFKAIDFYKLTEEVNNVIRASKVVSMKTTTIDNVTSWLADAKNKKNITDLLDGLVDGIKTSGKTINYTKAELHIYLPKAKFATTDVNKWIADLKTFANNNPNITFYINTIENYIP